MAKLVDDIGIDEVKDRVAVVDQRDLRIERAEDGGVLHTDYCLLSTSDAADERSSVDLGCRRIIKTKKELKSSSQSQN